MGSAPGARTARRLLAVLAMALLLAGTTSPAAAEEGPVVRAVLFFSPTCSHCEYVIMEYLFPEQFPETGGEPDILPDPGSAPEGTAFYLVTNGRLEMLFVDITLEAGGLLYEESGIAFEVPSERRGVPRLLVADRYLVGSGEIPAEFPGIVAAGLAAGGIDWPDLPGLAEAVASVPREVPDDPTTTTGGAHPTATTTGDTPTTTSAEAGPVTTAGDASTTTTSGAGPATTAGGAPTTTGAGPALGTGDDRSVWERFGDDAVANSLAVVVLVLMVAALVWVALQGRRPSAAGPAGLLVPILGVAGLGIAAYLFLVETGGSDAVCGPVGNCNVVQDSKYAELFGFVPIGLIGIVGYVLVLAAWGRARYGSGRSADVGGAALLAGAVAGTGFSVYLTVLEPFVIGASCAWCLTSAVIVTAVMVLAARPGIAAWTRLRSAG
jgi:uncharacterized membrane protein